METADFLCGVYDGTEYSCVPFASLFVARSWRCVFVLGSSYSEAAAKSGVPFA